MDPNVIKKTQDTLGKVVKKPPLTEKLLSKPPFRFLHDIVTEVMKANGFFKGLFKTEEMNSTNVKDKDAKIAFLQKAIDCVVFVTGESLSTRPSKIVAGHEPEKTNEFLQLLGKACLKKLDSQEGVKKVLSGEKPGPGSSSKRKEARSKSGKDKEKPNEKENKPAVENGVNKDTVNEDEHELKRKSSGSSRVHSSDKSKHREKEAKERDSKERTRERSKEREKDRESGKEKKESKEKPVTTKTGVITNGNIGNELTPNMGQGDDDDNDDDVYNRNIPRPSSAKGQRRRPKNGDGEDSDGEIDEGEQLGEQVDKTNTNNTTNNDLNGLADSPPPARRKLARPSSARPAPPRKRRQQEEQEDAMTKIGPTAQVSNVIVDNNKDDEEDDTFLVEEASPAVTQDITHADESEPAENVTEGEHGALVKKMLETKKELEGTNKSKQEASAKPLMNDAHRRKQREHAQKEIDKLRESIQTLCRSANPLGKIMDYVQEDMDSMQKELEMWREENRQHQIALKREQSITESEIEPLKSHLANMETDVTEMLDRISTVKCNILRNEEKIQTLLAGVSFS